MDSQPARRQRRPQVVLVAPFFMASLALSLLIVTMISNPTPSGEPVDLDKEERKKRANDMIKELDKHGAALTKKIEAETSPPPPGPDTITPTFAWPKDLSLQVEYAKKIRTRGRFIPVERSRFTFDAPAQEDGSRVLRSSDLIQIKPNGDTLSAQEGAMHLIKQQGLGELLANASISAQGSVVTPNTAPKLIERTRTLMFGTATPEPSAMTRRVSEEIVAYRTTLLWDTLVAKWVGKTWKLGEEVKVEFDGLSPMLGVYDLPIPHRAKLAYQGSAWCDPQVRKKACVSFVMVLSPSPVAASKAMKGALDGAGEGATADIDKIELYERHLVVTDPSTLIPHRHTIDTLLNFTASITLPGQPAQPQSSKAEVPIERVYRPSGG